MKSTARRLITIPLSHYCEKARWGLERLGLDYHEERHLQVLHYPRTWWFSKGPNVPVLVDQGKVIQDSTRILQHLDRYASPDQQLYPDDAELCKEVESWEDLFDETLGVESRRWVYHHFSGGPVLMARALVTAAQGVPLHEKLLCPLLFPFIKRVIDTLVKPDKHRVDTGTAASRRTVARLDALLSDGRPYLVGNRFSAADLSLACMFSPYVIPENYGIRLPTLDAVPPAMREDILSFMETATGRYVLRLFDQERPRPSYRRAS